MFKTLKELYVSQCPLSMLFIDVDLLPFKNCYACMLQTLARGLQPTMIRLGVVELKNGQCHRATEHFPEALKLSEIEQVIRIAEIVKDDIAEIPLKCNGKDNTIT